MGGKNSGIYKGGGRAKDGRDGKGRREVAFLGNGSRFPHLT